MVCSKLNGAVFIPPDDRDQTGNMEWPNTGESFWSQIKSTKCFIFTLLQSDEIFCIKKSFWKIFNAVFSEQSGPTSMSFHREHTILLSR